MRGKRNPRLSIIVQPYNFVQFLQKRGQGRLHAVPVRNKRRSRRIFDKILCREIADDKVLREEWLETNYKLRLKYFSCAMGRRNLAARLAKLFGEGAQDSRELPPFRP